MGLAIEDPSLCSLICIIKLASAFSGFIINSLTFFAICYRYKRFSPKVKLVINIMLANFVVILGLILETIFKNEQAFLQCWTVVMKIASNVKHAGIILMILGLNSLCLDLYLAINHSFRYKSLVTRKRVNVLILLMWLFSFSLGFSIDILDIRNLIQSASVSQPIECYADSDYFDSLTTNSTLTKNLEKMRSLENDQSLRNKSYKNINVNTLISDWKKHYPDLTKSNGTFEQKSFGQTAKFHYFKYHLVVTSVLGISIIVMGVCLLLIYVKLRKRDNDPLMRRRNIRSNRKGAVTVLLLFLMFLVIMMPYVGLEFFTFVYSHFIPNSDSQDFTQGQLKLIVKFLPYLKALAISYAVLNPLMFSLRMREIQEGYRDLCGSRNHRSKSSRASTSSPGIRRHRRHSQRSVGSSLTDRPPCSGMQGDGVNSECILCRMPSFQNSNTNGEYIPITILR